MRDEAGNISAVIRAGLCTMCGTCYAVCPRDNIELCRDLAGDFFLRVRDAGRCAGCGLCARVCPGARVDLNALNQAVFGRVPDDAIVGVYRGVFITRAADDGVRSDGASGGTIGALTRYLLRNRLVDGVLTSRIGTPEEPFRPHSFIARSVEDLNGTGGSIYQVFPANAGLRGKVSAHSRLACVGLGCQIRGLRKAAGVLGSYREGIELTIGLICGHNASYAGTDHLLSRLGVCRRQVHGLRFRAGPHPGKFRVETRSGRACDMRFRDFTYMLTLFQKERCAVCTDPLNALADISTGDAWLPDLRRRGGWNVTIARTEKGEALLDRAAKDGAIEMRPAGVEVLMRTQKLTLYRRGRCGEAKLRILRFLGKKTPVERGMVREKPRRQDYLRALEMLVPQWIFRSAERRRMLGFLVPVLLFADEISRARKDRTSGRSREWVGQLFSTESEARRK